MAKARGRVTRSNTPQKAYAQLGEPEVEIAVWCPDEEAKEPPEQVHFIFRIPGLEDYPLVLRYKSPDTLGFFIEELTRYRRTVWPDAEPVAGEAVSPVVGGDLEGVDLAAPGQIVADSALDLIPPVLARFVGNGLQIVSGHMRLEAMVEAGLPVTIQVIGSEDEQGSEDEG